MKATINDDAPQTHTSMGKVVTASISGALLEWYDFFIYGTASALVFGKIFFPEFDSTTAVIASFATFGAGFFARPVGGLVFGHFGDKLGRKVALIWTLLIMGVSTTLIGLLPTYEQVGVWAPILLVALRLVQGFGLGGEYGGAALLTIEHAPENRRGFFGSLPQCAASAGILLATGVFSILEHFLTDEQMHTFGWRIPFLLSALMLLIGLFIRTHTSESPEFVESQRRLAEEGINNSDASTSPIVFAIKNYPKALGLAFGARIAETVSSNIVNAFGISYIATQLAMDRQIPLNGMLLASAVGLCLVPVLGWLSDRIGLKKIYLIGTIAVIVMAFPFFGLLNTENVAIIWFALIVTYNCGPTTMFAVQPTLFTQVFGPRVRYTGLSVAYQFSAIVGGLTPMICAWLIALGNGSPWGVAAYMAAIGLISFVCTLKIKPMNVAELVEIDHQED